MYEEECEAHGGDPIGLLEADMGKRLQDAGDHDRDAQRIDGTTADAARIECEDDGAENGEVFDAVRMCAHGALVPFRTLDLIGAEGIHLGASGENLRPAVHTNGEGQYEHGPSGEAEQHPDRRSHALNSPVRLEVMQDTAWRMSVDGRSFLMLSNVRISGALLRVRWSHLLGALLSFPAKLLRSCQKSGLVVRFRLLGKYLRIVLENPRQKLPFLRT